MEKNYRFLVKTFLRDKKFKLLMALPLTRMHSSMMRTIRCSSHLPGGVSAQGGYLSNWGVYTSPPGTEFLTHTCENITFPQLRLRTVMKGSLASLSHWCILGAIGVFVGENDQRITYPPDRTPESVNVLPLHESISNRTMNYI